MGSRWGLNRTLGQMCGLVYIVPNPLNADEIAETFNISGSNVSMGSKELKTWRLVRPASVSGDRREYWTTSKDEWEIFRILAEERRRREIDPTLSMLRETLMTEPTLDGDRYTQERLREMHDLIETLNNWVDDMNSRPSRILKLGRKIQSLLDPRRKKTNPTEATSA
jgi:DNA-binding transcriptional regulator GbsR (MarR family)